MADTKESSVLFSLRELMTLEEDRIRTEDAAKQRQAEETRRRREDELAVARAEEAARLAAAEDAQRVEEQRRMAEAERLRRERAEGELRVRLEAESRARQEEQTRLLAHEQRLATLAAQHKRGIGAAGLVGIVAGVLALGSSGVWFGVMRPAHERALQEATARDHDQAAQEAVRNAERARDDARRAQLETEARVARERADAADRLRQIPPPSGQTPTQPSGHTPHVRTNRPHTPHQVTPFDPLNGIDP